MPESLFSQFSYGFPSFLNDHRNEKTLEGKFDKFFDNATQFFSKTTDRQLYTYRNILEYIDGEYVITNKISDKNLLEMRENMNDEDQQLFDQFVEKKWGTKTPVRTKERAKSKI